MNDISLCILISIGSAILFVILLYIIYIIIEQFT